MENDEKANKNEDGGKSLAFNLILAAILLIAIPLFIIVGGAWRYAVNEATVLINENNLEFTNQLSSQIDDHLASLENNADILIDLLDSRRRISSDVYLLTQDIVDNEEVLHNISFFDSQGYLVYSTGHLDFDLLIDNELSAELDQREDLSSWEEWLVIQDDDTRYLQFLRGYSNGLITMTVNTEGLKEILGSATIGRAREVFLFDDSGQIILGTDSDIIGSKNISDYSFFKEAMEEDQFSVAEKDAFSEENELIAAGFIADLNLGLAVSQPASIAYGIINSTTNILLGGIFLTLLLGILVSRQLLKKIVSPLQAFSNKAESIASGEREVDFSGGKIKEINKLGNSFNKMLTQIKEKEDRLKSQKEELAASYEQLEAFNEETAALNDELEESYDKMNDMVNRLEQMIDLTSNLSSTVELQEEEFLQDLLATAITMIPEADYGSVYLYHEDSVEFVATEGHVLEILKKIKFPRSPFETPKGEIVVVENIETNTLPTLPPEESKIFLEGSKEIHETLTFDLFFEDTRMIGLSLDIARDNYISFSAESQKTLEAFYSLATAFYSMQQMSRLKGEFQRDILMAMVRLLSFHDEYTEFHSQNVAELAAQIADKLDLTEEKIKNAYWAGLVHDIGKTLVPGRILNKPEDLSDEEYEIIKQHPVWAYEVLNTSDKLAEIARYVLHHHERIDGDGYPKGLTKEEIPLCSRILNVADAWDAMRSKRAYRDPLSRSKAREELQENAGSQFDEEIVAAFMEVLKNNEN